MNDLSNNFLFIVIVKSVTGVLIKQFETVGLFVLIYVLGIWC